MASAEAARSAAPNPIRALGRSTLTALRTVGGVAVFALRGVAAALTPRWFWDQLLRQFAAIGFFSLPVVGLTAVFTGAALALNIFTGGGRFNAEQVMPQIVALGITRELGPVLAALMLAGRVSAAIAAEIGAMRATEQIDAMRTLSTDPFRYLVAPRLLAGVLMLPLLTAVADTIGVAGGWLVATRVLSFNPTIYIRNTITFLESWDVVSGLIKAGVFGFIVTLMGCYHGYNASGGARGVGRATTHAVVSSAILIFASDYLLTTLFTHAS
ncbi:MULTISPECIES: ABC transporter permease [Caulobacter]|jgi:phospholipid/cholesterol/gamma-HCH transport system permease protein|uniref:Putative integral membrane protein n=1 Tax=Caulobacter vibrioides OR37 TaxID=1292034 RepID=R0D302_CAUVI|nr:MULTISPECIES: ABC transporter permease [Caulobacter]ENZ82795.1 putative integral membrane protein [Caulobacter vibrioides OR37]MBQ1559545.1 ABC transporter permease [Caulobacter sp.]